MSLAEIPDGESVFIDANIFVYHFTGQSRECCALLERCARAEILGYTSTSTLAEMIHRLMIAEAIQRGLVTREKAVPRLKERPNIVMQLTRYQVEFVASMKMNVRIMDLTTDILAASAAIRDRHGLLTNDSLVVAFMEAAGIRNLATSDSDFERVESVTFRRPTDIGLTSQVPPPNQ